MLISNNNINNKVIRKNYCYKVILMYIVNIVQIIALIMYKVVIMKMNVITVILFCV